MNPVQEKLLRDPILRRRWKAVQAATSVAEIRRALPRLLADSAKTVKGEKKGILTGVLYLSPSTESGVNLCPFASPGCAAACLGHSSGRMGMVVGGGLGDHKRARILRTWAFIYQRSLFLAALRHEIALLQARARRLGMRPFVRLNGTSDLPWTMFGVIERFPRVQFYDYTKSPGRAIDNATGKHPENYHVTFSRSETNAADCRDVLRSGGNVAVVFRERPETWNGAPVIDGDETDGRPDDRRGVVVGLSAKGPLARRDTSGFVV